MIFKYFELYRTIFLVHLCLSRSIIVYLGLAWAILDSIAHSHCLSQSWVIPVYIWLFWAMSGYLRLSLGILGNLWLSVAIYLWLSWVISGYLGVPQDRWSILEYIGPYLLISGYLWLSLAISSCFWLSLAISCYLRLFLAISS